MAVKVIAGGAQGRRLRVPGGGRTRPTSGLVRGALFNMLEHRGWLTDARILDCFAGTGALGIEAISRGATGAIFVESSSVVVRTLRANVDAAGMSARSLVMPMDVGRALRALARDGTQVDGVFADPPYHQGWAQRVVDAVTEAGVLAERGWIAIEHAADETVEPRGDLITAATRRHGSTTLALLARPG